MSGGERPIGTAKGKQANTEALCQTPPGNGQSTAQRDPHRRGRGRRRATGLCIGRGRGGFQSPLRPNLRRWCASPRSGRSPPCNSSPSGRPQTRCATRLMDMKVVGGQARKVRLHGGRGCWHSRVLSDWLLASCGRGWGLCVMGVGFWVLWRVEREAMRSGGLMGWLAESSLHRTNKTSQPSPVYRGSTDGAVVILHGNQG